MGEAIDMPINGVNGVNGGCAQERIEEVVIAGAGPAGLMLA